MQRLVLALFMYVLGVASRQINFLESGGVPEDSSLETCEANSNLLTKLLNSLTYGDFFEIPADHTFWLQGGIEVSFKGPTISIDGILKFSDNLDAWPRNDKDPNNHVKEAISMYDIEDVLFTTSDANIKAGKKGVIDGSGRKWWGAINFLKHQEDRPRLWHIYRSRNITIKHLLLLDSAYWTFYAEQCDGLFIHHSDVSAKRTDLDRHDLFDLTAFNTDGFDVTGRNVHITDANIWNQDDCIAVKDDPVISENMLFERISCSGLGLVIGSIGDSKVKNITFRDCVLPHSFKGIYLKTRWDDRASNGEAFIEDITYENIYMDKPEQWAIWIGPAQQTGQPCSLLWPEHHGKCQMSGFNTWKNIVLRNITIVEPKQSPGIVFGNASNPIQGLVFDSVHVKNPGKKPFGDDFWFCQDVDMEVLNSDPAPKCTFT